MEISKGSTETMQRIIVFCDGACSGNPGPGGWGAVIAKPEGHILELGGREIPTTNNQMEMTAVLQSLRALAQDPRLITVYTDSVYVIRGITEWIHGWRRRSWLTAEGGAVANRELWEALDRVVRQREPKSIEWKFVKGHSGVPGNERVDEIAVAFTANKRIKLYNGPLGKYEVAIYDLPPDRPLPEIKPKLAKTEVYSYLSYVDGELQRHKTWDECKARVHGRPAKFKKTSSAAEEAQILQDWGLHADALD